MRWDHGVIDALRTEQTRFGAAVLQIQVEYLLEILAIFESDGFGRKTCEHGVAIALVFGELIVQRYVYQMSLPSPLVSGGKGCGGKDALNAELGLVFGHEGILG